MSTTTANLGLFKYDITNPTDLAAAFNINTALNNNWDKIDEAISNSGGARNIGEIVSSTIPLTDAGLHLLDGSLINGSGIYAEFVNYIAGLDLTANYFCTEQEWQQSITDYGVCGKFVYDSTNNTVRIPKVTGFIEGTTDVTALGDLVEAGLPNIIGNAAQNLPMDLTTSTSSGAIYTIVSGGKFGGMNSGSSHSWQGLYFDASRASSIYGNSTTVQPQTIKAFYYIVVATSTKTSIRVDIDEITTDLNYKVDKRDLHEVQCVVETYSNSNSWYRVYSDGWCEQGGTRVATTTWETIVFLKPFIDSNYTALVSNSAGGTNANGIRNKTTTSMQIYQNWQYDWQVSGYII